MEHENKRGGRREGAGRKFIDPAKKKVQQSFSITPEAKQRLSQLREQGVNVNALVDEFILNL